MNFLSSSCLMYTFNPCFSIYYYCLLLLAFILCWLYSPGISFCFFWFSFSPVRPPSSRLGQSALFQSEPLHVAGSAPVWLNLPRRSVSSYAALLTGMCSVTWDSTSKPSSSALFCIFKHVQPAPVLLEIEGIGSPINLSAVGLSGNPKTFSGPKILWDDTFYIF